MAIADHGEPAEIRINRLTGRWVIYATARASRPGDLAPPPSPPLRRVYA